MANTLRFKRGLASGIPTALAGEPLFTTDTFDLYIGNGTGNTRFQKYIASGTTSQLLRGDGSLLTMPIVLTSPANGQVLKYDGTNWVNSSDAGVTGSGTAGQVTYWGSASTITGSNNLFWDATNSRLGIGTNSLFTPLTVATINARFEFSEVSSILHAIESINTARSTSVELGLYNRALRVFTRPSGTGSYVNNFTITDNGRLLLGNTTDNGLRFQVTGDGSFSGGVGIGGTPGAGNLRLSKTIVGTGSTFGYGVLQEGVIQSNVTSFSMGFYNLLQTQATSFTLNSYYHYHAQQATLGAGSAINSQYGYFVQNTLTGATNNYGFYGDIASGTGRWNLYMNGTAANYLAGSLGIGTSADLTFTSLRINKLVSGASTSYSVLNGGQIQSTVSVAYYNRTLATTQAATFTLNALVHYAANQSTLGAGSTVTNQYGYIADPTLIGATNNYGFYGEIPSGTGRWNLYMNGTANNYLAGNLGVGVTPSAWSAYKALEIGGAGSSLWSVGANDIRLATNYVFNSGGKYVADGLAAQYQQTVGQHRWFTAPTGTAGNAITFTQAMTLDASGSLGLGVVPSAWSLASLSAMQIQNGGFYGYSVNEVGVTSNSYYNAGWKYINSSFATQYSTFNGAHRWFNASSGTAGAAITFTQAMTLHPTGNLAIGTGAGADAAFKLDVNGTMRVSGASTLSGNMTNAFASLAGGTTVIGGITGVANGFRIDVDTSNQYQYSFRSGTNTTLFQIANTGAATFSTSVSVASGVTNQGYLLTAAGTTALTRLQMGTAVTLFSNNYNAFSPASQDNAAIPSWQIRFGGGTGADFYRIERSPAGSTTMSQFFNLDGTGAATFSSSVTAKSFAINTSGQSRTITTFYGSGSDGSNIFIGGGGLSSTTGGGAATNGSYNTTLGVNALLSNTTGYSNTVMGASSMVYNTTGLNNSAFGRSSLGDNTTGDDNTSVGLAALLTNTTGDGNTALGFQAGWGTGTNANTTGGNNIFIGNLSVGESATESNRTWIGNTSTASTWVGGNLLVGTRTNGSYKADINGTLRATQFNLSALNTAPATSSSTGTLGEIRIDADHIYVCTATNTWKRVAISTF